MFYNPERSGNTPKHTSMRFDATQEPTSPYGYEYGVSRPVSDFHYDIAYPDVPPNNLHPATPSGNFARGNIIRQYQPRMHPPMLGYFTYNPNDPTTWHQGQH